MLKQEGLTFSLVKANLNAMTTLNTSLKLALIKGQKQKNLLQKGFTLVELMIVIVIVGVLSAVALPNFLSQTDKAKATEAKSNITAILKQVQTYYLETGGTPAIATGNIAVDTDLADYGAPANGDQKFNYTGQGSGDIYTVMAKGNGNDGNLTDKKIFGCVNLETGVLETTSNLTDADSTTTSDVDCNDTAGANGNLS